MNGIVLAMKDSSMFLRPDSLEQSLKQSATRPFLYRPFPVTLLRQLIDASRTTKPLRETSTREPTSITMETCTPTLGTSHNHVLPEMRPSMRLAAKTSTTIKTHRTSVPTVTAKPSLVPTEAESIPTAIVTVSHALTQTKQEPSLTELIMLIGILRTKLPIK